MTMQIRPYRAHGAQFVTIADGPKDCTILASEGETIAQTLARYITNERNTARKVAERIAFFQQALTLATGTPA